MSLLNVGVLYSLCIKLFVVELDIELKICKNGPCVPIFLNFPIKACRHIESNAFEKSTKQVISLLFLVVSFFIIDLKRTMCSVILWSCRKPD